MTRRSNTRLFIVFVASLVITAVVVFGLDKQHTEQVDNPRAYFDNSSMDCDKVAPRYVGLSRSQAENQASHVNRPYRVVLEDGNGSPITDDFSPNRINFDVSKGKVTKAVCY